MASRREFLQAGLAASLLPVAASAASSGSPAPESPANFYKVIFDERFPASVAFGAEWKARGAAVHAIRGDMTDLWFQDLDPQWKKRPVPIAGLTAHGPLFCLERLAWDHGMRVVERVEHGAQNGEELFFWVIAPKEDA
ncbi:MAG TPA: hypothetical protein VME17_15135 [Bryobacteraceae bacterium]|nr:hypothetical protein [Bryobacteraceae bacterium]